MTQRRVTATNQFSTVIDALQLGKKTGILTVERGEGGSYEEGTITLVNGQVVQATLGLYQGREAATKLFSWQACRFSFTPADPGQIGVTQGISPIPAVPADRRTTDRRSQYGLQLTNPGGQDNWNRHPFPTAHALESLDTILLLLDRQGFSRMHRRLFLLVDGKRSITELAMLVRRTQDETMVLLTDLEQAGFIQL